MVIDITKFADNLHIELPENRLKSYSSLQANALRVRIDYFIKMLFLKNQ